MAPRLDNPVAITRVQDLTEDHVRFFRDNPAMLDLNSDRDDFSFWKCLGLLVLAVAFLAASRLVVTQYADAMSQFLSTVLVDVVFEMGAALIGAIATVMFISFQNRRQFEKNLRLRIEIERRIALLDAPE